MLTCRCFLLIILSLHTFLISQIHSAETPTLRQRDFEAVQEFINSKRTLAYDEKPPCLTLSGNVKFNIITRTERQDGMKLRGIRKADGTFVPFNDFDVEMNLKVKYKTDRTWAQGRLQLYNPAGIRFIEKTCLQDPEAMQGSGACNEICLREAFFGMNVVKDYCQYYFDVVIGRKRIFQEFDSRIEFNQRLDGIVFEIGKKLKPDWKIYDKTAFFVVDSRSNNYAYVTELGTYDFFETKYDIKFSFIDWKTFAATNRCGVRHPLGSNFQIFHTFIAYNINPKLLWDIRGKIYYNFMVNFAAKQIKDILTPAGLRRFPDVTNDTKQNIGWCVGFIMGDQEMNKVGDFAIDVNYQYVQAQAVSDFDARGIGRGNINREVFTANGRGKTNYKGYIMEAVWAISKCISLDLAYEATRQIDRRIGGLHRYTRLELDIIYQF